MEVVQNLYYKWKKVQEKYIRYLMKETSRRKISASMLPTYSDLLSVKLNAAMKANMKSMAFSKLKMQENAAVSKERVYQRRAGVVKKKKFCGAAGKRASANVFLSLADFRRLRRRRDISSLREKRCLKQKLGFIKGSLILRVKICLFEIDRAEEKLVLSGAA